MRAKVEKLKSKISKLEKLPFDQVKRENEALQQENSVLGQGSKTVLSWCIGFRWNLFLGSFFVRKVNFRLEVEMIFLGGRN